MKEAESFVTRTQSEWLTEDLLAKFENKPELLKRMGGESAIWQV